MPFQAPLRYNASIREEMPTWLVVLLVAALAAILWAIRSKPASRREPIDRGPGDREDLTARLAAADLEARAERIAAAALPSIAIEVDPPRQEKLPVGASKLGGRPDLPAGTAWPEWKGTPLAFLAQFDLSRSPGPSLLPTKGLLSFFYVADQSTWGYDPKHRGSWAVLYFESTDGLAPAVLPDALPKEGRFVECAARRGTRLSLPGYGSAALDEIGLSDAESDRYLDLVARWHAEPDHRLLGHPNLVQNPMELECQLASNGIYVGDAEGYNDPRVEELKLGAKDWVLLFQLDTEDKAGMMWGDAGRLYFWIRTQDLAARGFDAAWTILQCY